MSYEQFSVATRRLAAGLVSLDIGRGDKVRDLPAERNRVSCWPMFAAARVGALLVPLHGALTRREAKHVLAHAATCRRS